MMMCSVNKIITKQLMSHAKPKIKLWCLGAEWPELWAVSAALVYTAGLKTLGDYVIKYHVPW